MTRPVTVLEAQDQILETALDFYRMVQRLHRCRQGLGIPYETAYVYYEAEGRPDEPPTIELAVAEEINVAIDELQGLADGLRKAARITTESIRDEWREERQGRRS